MITRKYPIFCLIAVCAIILAGCNREQQLPGYTAVVKTYSVRSDEGRSIVRYSGKVKAGAEANVAFRVAGTIALIPVEVGDYVTKGQVIAILDDRDYKIQLEATEAEFARINADAGRVIELFKRGSAPASEYDKATYGLQQITAKLEAHRNALADTRLKAPFDGFIQKKMFKSGEIIGAGMQVISMVGSGQPEMEINITALDFIRKEQALTYTARMDVIPGKELPLEVIGIARKANLNQLYTVRLKFKDPKLNKLLTPGLTAEVIIKFPTSENRRLTVPLSSITRDQENSYVWLFQNNKVTRQQVVVDEITGEGTAIITGGLNENDIIVTAGIKSLKEGMQVKQLPPASTSNMGNLK